MEDWAQERSDCWGALDSSQQLTLIFVGETIDSCPEHQATMISECFVYVFAQQTYRSCSSYNLAICSMLTHCQVRDEFSRLTLSSTAPALVKVFFCNRCIGGSRIYKSLLFSTILSSHTQHNNTMAQSSRPHGYVADINFRWQLGILILIMAI